jgi:hypothetical protein
MTNVFLYALCSMPSQIRNSFLCLPLTAYSLVKYSGFPSLILEKINHLFLIFLLTGDADSKVICGTAGVLFF